MNCNICGWSGPAFKPGPRGEKFCPECRSRSRWRHIKHWLDASFTKLTGSVLLVGASNVEESIYKSMKRRVCISGVNPNHGTIMDLSDLKLKDASFDIVHACHVLEHVEKLSKGLEEVRRVLKPHGIAIFCVAIPRRAKSKMRGKPDKQGHWWLIGKDWSDCYTAAGFHVAHSRGRDCPSGIEVNPDNHIDICEKDSLYGN